MKVQAWRIEPGVDGYAFTLVPQVFEDAWGLEDLARYALDNLLEDGHGHLTIELVEVPLSNLLDLEVGDDGYAIDLYEREFIEAYGEAEVREADKHRPSANRHWPEPTQEAAHAE